MRFQECTRSVQYTRVINWIILVLILVYKKKKNEKTNCRNYRNDNGILYSRCIIRFGGRLLKKCCKYVRQTARHAFHLSIEDISKIRLENTAKPIQYHGQCRVRLFENENEEKFRWERKKERKNRSLLTFPSAIRIYQR